MSEFSQRPARPAHAASHAATAKTSSSKGSKKSGMNGMHIGVGIMLIAGALLALATVALLALNSGSALDKENDRILGDRYQAVFLDSQDGQVYFGRLAAVDSQNFELHDIYYVQVETQIQPDTGQTQTTGISLAKLGNELHGPEDIMYIQKDQVLFWENLKDSGQVVCAIRDYQINELGIEGITKDPACDEREAAAQQQQGAAGTQPAGTPQVNDTPDTTPTTPADTPATP